MQNKYRVGVTSWEVLGFDEGEKVKRVMFLIYPISHRLFILCPELLFSPFRHHVCISSFLSMTDSFVSPSPFFSFHLHEDGTRNSYDDE